MKKLLTAAVVLLSVGAYAQPANVVNAYNYWKGGELNKAKAAIDKAAVHPKTAPKEKTWRYRGDIYYAIGSSADPAVKAIDGKPLIKAYESYAKQRQIDKKGSYKREVLGKLGVIRNMALNEGVGKFNEKMYAEAIENFDVTINIAELSDQTDTLAYYNKALAYDRMEDWGNAVSAYQKCADLGYRVGEAYSLMYSIHNKNGEKDKALEVIKKGREAAPNDANLIIYELNTYLQQGKFDEAEKNLGLAIEKDPKNEMLHFSLGSVYDNLKKYDEAEAAYMKALEIDGEYFDANYNLGALFFNKGVEMNNNIPDDISNKEYEVEKEKINQVFLQALPYLEAARELKPEDKNTLASLLQLYARTSQNDKYNEVKAAMDAMK